jgi:dynein heavy chain
LLIGDESKKDMPYTLEATIKTHLKRLRKLTKGIDIGDKISDMNKQGANIQYISNPIDTGIQSIEDYWKHNDPIQPVRTKSK